MTDSDKSKLNPAQALSPSIVDMIERPAYHLPQEAVQSFGGPGVSKLCRRFRQDTFRVGLSLIGRIREEGG